MIVEEQLSYCEETGDLVWKVSRKGVRKGSKAGYFNTAGYHVVRVNGESYYGHRLAFYLKEGRWPEEIDHIDGDRGNNCWSNLRECSKAQNRAYRSVPKKKNKLPKGVFPESGKFLAYIKKDKKFRRLGLFPTPELAAEAYDKAAKELFGDFAKTNKDCYED